MKHKIAKMFLTLPMNAQAQNVMEVVLTILLVPRLH